MKEDIWRLGLVLVASLLIGIVTGQVLLCLLVGLAGFMYWQYRIFAELLNWLQRPGDFPAPETSGIVDEIARKFDYLRAHHKKRKSKLSGFIKRFQKASAALPDAIIILGENGKIEWANKKAFKYFGIRWPQDGNQRLSNLIRYPKLLKFLESSQGHDPDKRLEIISPIDAHLRLEIRLAPYGGGQRLMVARNITRLHRINQMRSDFIANASHELRTPLTVIAGYLEAADVEGTDGNLIATKQIRQMRSQTDRMRRLIEELLLLASLESEEEPANRELLHVADIVEGIVSDAKMLSGSSSHQFNTVTDSSLGVMGNHKELYSAFSNLVFNAVQHSPEGTEIYVNWFRDQDCAYFEVSYNGKGISPKHLPRITERFYRADPARTRDKGGTGLGLAIVKHTLARHRARLEIESEEGEGSTFRCVFPEHLVDIPINTSLPKTADATS